MAPSSSHLHLLLLLVVASLLCRIMAVSVPRTTGPQGGEHPVGLFSVSGSGKRYHKVCDAARFADMGLNMARYQFCNASLPYADRVRDLVGWMTLEEKVGNLGDISKGAPRIGLPPYKWWSEALHGVSDTGPATKFDHGPVHSATVFPNVINSAAAFNETLWKTIGQAISTEARALYNLGEAGLTFWSPNINVVRDPRWGRTLETPGEDPFVVGRYAVNFVRGMQDIAGHETSDDLFSRPIKVSVCCKHYAAYDVDAWYEYDRFTFDARVHERDMAETFLRPFEMCVREGDVSSVMCSYNRVNGVPTCADARLLSQTIRGDWQLHGYIVSDCDSVRVMVRDAKWLNQTGVEASAKVMKAGLDLDCGMSWIKENGKPVQDFLSAYGMAAVEQGKMREADIDNALTNQFMTLMRVGYFDDIRAFASLNEHDVCSDEHRELAVDGARQGMVLLKNDNNLLPLEPKKLRSVALRGPHVKATKHIMDGDYTGPPCRYVTPFDAISKDVKVADDATTTFYFAGINLDVEREGNDREDILLPWGQPEEIKRVAAASKNPIVLVILSAGGVDISFAKNNPKIGAILWAGYPGEEGGTAIADVIFGRYNPGGRLPITWYTNEYIKQIPLTSMELRPVPKLGYPGRTYKFYDGPEVLYPFGHGLSYTKFSYGECGNGTTVTMPTSGEHCKPLTYKPGVNSPACPAVNVVGCTCNETISFDVKVINGGDRDGSHVVLVYTMPPPEVADAPIKQVVAFQRVFVPARSTATVPFKLNLCKAFGIVEKTAYTVLPSGVSKVMIGNDESSVSFPVEIKFVL